LHSMHHSPDSTAAMAMPPEERLVGRSYWPPAVGKGVSEKDRTSVKRPYRVEAQELSHTAWRGGAASKALSERRDATLAEFGVSVDKELLTPRPP
jgi:hypothetical protein